MSAPASFFLGLLVGATASLVSEWVSIRLFTLHDRIAA